MGTEVDLVVERGSELLAVETKAGGTFHAEHAASLHAYERTVSRSRSPTRKPVCKIVVYTGRERFFDQDVEVLPWDCVGAFEWAG